MIYHVDVLVRPRGANLKLRNGSGVDRECHGHRNFFATLLLGSDQVLGHTVHSLDHVLGTCLRGVARS